MSVYRRRVEKNYTKTVGFFLPFVHVTEVHYTTNPAYIVQWYSFSVVHHNIFYTLVVSQRHYVTATSIHSFIHLHTHDISITHFHTHFVWLLSLLQHSPNTFPGPNKTHSKTPRTNLYTVQAKTYVRFINAHAQLNKDNGDEPKLSITHELPVTHPHTGLKHGYK